jgi:hypothetical protein
LRKEFFNQKEFFMRQSTAGVDLSMQTSGQPIPVLPPGEYKGESSGTSTPPRNEVLDPDRVLAQVETTEELKKNPPEDIKANVEKVKPEEAKSSSLQSIFDCFCCRKGSSKEHLE